MLGHIGDSMNSFHSTAACSHKCETFIKQNGNIALLPVPTLHDTEPIYHLKPFERSQKKKESDFIEEAAALLECPSCYPYTTVGR